MQGLDRTARIRRAVGGGHDPAIGPPTTGEWLEEWLAEKKNLRRAGSGSWPVSRMAAVMASAMGIAVAGRGDGQQVPGCVQLSLGII